MSPTGTRAGVILYGDEPKLSVGLNDYNTLPEFYTILDDLVFESGGREPHKVNNYILITYRVKEIWDTRASPIVP